MARYTNLKAQGAIERNSLRSSAAGTCRGQGATEYLVLLGAVLLIGVIVVALLGFFPGTAPGISITESQSYWRTVARPIQITDASASTDGSTSTTLTMAVQNTRTDFLTINSVTVDGSNSTPSGLPVTIKPGGTTRITVSIASVCPAYTSYGMHFGYATSGVGNQTQTGEKPLVVQCGSACLNNAGVDVGPCASGYSCCCSGYSNAKCLNVCIECG
ncbi:Uncharacterised protein [uncultured archaeon]|nr:Uncharacterised protein [uncultured archaeon]